MLARRHFSLLLALATIGCVRQPPLDPTPPGYVNPVLDADFPDPAVLKAPDGHYYAYATQTERNGGMINIQVARSRDLVSWKHLGDALPAKPGWASKTQDFWAPHVARHGSLYYLYYSAKPDAALADSSLGLCLAVATARRPEGPFTDKGVPMHCGAGFVNIDPMSYDDPETGKRLLYWGSGFEPIRVRELAPDRLSFQPGSVAADLVPADPKAAYRKLVEGAWVVRRGGYYYLFFSGDNCCGPGAHYAALVARSRSATGPFEIRDIPVVEARGKWHAPGHNSVVEDRRGRHWILYHAVDKARPRAKEGADVNTRRILLIDRLVWEDGWPRLADGGPSERPQPRPGS